MSNTLKIALISCLAGIVIGHWGFGPRIITEIEEKVKTVTRTVIKENPDGSKETIIDEKTEADSSTIEKVAQKDWRVTAGSGIVPKQSYQLAVHKRIIGDIYVGAFGSTTGSYGISLGFRF